MRKPSTLDALFTAPRQGILVATLMQPERWWYLSDLARHLQVHHATLQRELARLSAVEILQTRWDGNRVYYRANQDAPVFPELCALLAKTAGLGDVLRDVLRPFAGKIGFAFVYGSIARAAESVESDVDVMIVGDVSLKTLAPALRAAEKRIGRPVNASLYDAGDFTGKVKAGNHFVLEVLEQPKLFIVGTHDDLEQMAQGWPNRGARPRAHRDRRTKTGR